ncbi:MAG: hypothetical protein CMJ75_19690 [Planctomycetaceae bacterium]|nr:hypothetical protein [Planctomycetaceae bacterium]
MSESLTAVKRQNAGRPSDGTSDPSDWGQWGQHLRHRVTPIGLRESVKSGGRKALRWGLSDAHHVTDAWPLLSNLEKVARKRTSKRKSLDSEIATELEVWLQGLAAREVSRTLGLECVAWSYALVDLTRELPAAPWCELLDQLVDVATDARRASSSDDPLVRQWLYGELPLALSCLFPELEQCQELHEPASEMLSSALIDLLDGEGLIHSGAIEIFRPLLASWTRCESLARANGRVCLNEEAQEQYDWMVLQMLRLCRRDGSQLFSVADEIGDWRKLAQAALELSGDPQDQAVASRFFSGRSKLAERSSKKSLPDAAVCSEWAGIAAMRTSWNRGATALGVIFGQDSVVAELSRGAQQIFAGPWDTDVCVDGKRLTVQGRWSELCWFSDEDVAYLELEAPLGNGIVLQRQCLLARKDEFLLLGHVVLSKKTVEMDLAVSWPIHAPMSLQPADETREITITDGHKPRFLALPLALPEWRAASAEGELVAAPSGLLLKQRGAVSRLEMPLFIDLAPRQRTKPYTWRQLTVAEDLRVQPREVATGYRVQIGRRQWIFYRSLAAKRIRTVLGQNLGCEYICGRFHANGSVETLIEIE